MRVKSLKLHYFGKEFLNPNQISPGFPNYFQKMLSAHTFDASQPLLVKRLSETAKLPIRGSKGAAGYDLFASKETVIPAKGLD